MNTRQIIQLIELDSKDRTSLWCRAVNSQSSTCVVVYKVKVTPITPIYTLGTGRQCTRLTSLPLFGVWSAKHVICIDFSHDKFSAPLKKNPTATNIFFNWLLDPSTAANLFFSDWLSRINSTVHRSDSCAGFYGAI